MDTVDSFETSVRLHLTRASQDWRDRVGRRPPRTIVPDKPPLVSTAVSQSEVTEAVSRAEVNDTDLGYLDYMDLVNDANERLKLVLGRMTSAVGVIGAKMLERVSEMETLASPPSPEATRSICSQTAEDLSDFSASLLGDIPQLTRAHSDLVKNLVGGAATSLEMGSGSKDQVLQILEQLDEFIKISETTREQMFTFSTNISRLPRMTASLNRAKRDTLDALDLLDATYESFRARTTEVRNEIADLLVRVDRAPQRVRAVSQS